MSSPKQVRKSLVSEALICLQQIIINYDTDQVVFFAVHIGVDGTGPEMIIELKQDRIHEWQPLVVLELWYPDETYICRLGFSEWNWKGKDSLIEYFWYDIENIEQLYSHFEEAVKRFGLNPLS